MLYSVILGVLVKVFDEIQDLGIKIDDVYVEIIKGAILFLFIILGYDDFSFSLSFFVVFLASYLAGGIDTSFWKSVTVILGCLSIYSFQSLSNLSWRIPAMLIMPVLVYLEAKMFPEEQSLNKILNRIGTSAFFGCIFIPSVHNLIQSKVGDIRFGEKQVLSVIGYYAVSICVQSYSLFFKPQWSNQPENSLLQDPKNPVQKGHK